MTSTKSTKAVVVRTPKGVKDPVKPTKAAVESVAAKVLAEFGGITAATADGLKASETLTRSESALRAWLPVAVDAKAAGVTARAFGEMSGGNPNTLGRMVALDGILRAGRKGRKAVPFWLAVADSNKSQTVSGNVIAALTRGEDVYGAVETRKDGARKGERGKRKSADSQSVKVSTEPTDWAATLRFITANLSKADAATVADISKAATILAVTAARAAGHPVTVAPVSVKPSRKAPKAAPKAAVA